jgi:hypothetical protein
MIFTPAHIQRSKEFIFQILLPAVPFLNLRWRTGSRYPNSSKTFHFSQHGSIYYYFFVTSSTKDEREEKKEKCENGSFITVKKNYVLPTIGSAM